ncbi:MAG TPA: CPBP family intramembrane glutamic endopeptidase [Thermomicrobiales bacterium]|nr:CPBP family intramembrane glutamic endopeptidase [Thermomicrobiales bacterium]
MKQALAGLALAAPAFAWTFRARRPNFWWRMTATAGGLGAYALAVEPALRDARPRPRDLVAGVATAGLLYGVFQVGDRLARRVMPAGGAEIGTIYELRRLLPRWAIAGLLATIIGPAEELFWRGLLQGTLMRRLGRWPGAALATACYGGVHLASGNLTLTGAAAVAGAWWGAQYALEGRLPALIASHICWDLWIFLVAPTPGAAPPRA